MRLFDADYYKTYLEPGMDEGEFKKRLIVALEAVQRIDPAHFQAICDGDDTEFVRLVKEEYKNSLLSEEKKVLEVYEADHIFLKSDEADISDLPEEEMPPMDDTLREELDAAYKEALLADLENQEKAEAKKERAKRSRKAQERYRIEADLRAKQYQAWLSSLPNRTPPIDNYIYPETNYQTEVYREGDGSRPFSYQDAMSVPYTYSQTTYDTPSYEKEPSLENPTQNAYPSSPEALYKEQRNLDYEMKKEERNRQNHEEMDTMRARFYERMKAWESYESVNRDGHFSFDEQKSSYPSEKNNIPFNVYANPYLSYEQGPYRPYLTPTYNQAPSYRELLEQKRRDEYDHIRSEKRADAKKELQDSLEEHLHKQRESAPYPNPSYIPYNAFSDSHYQNHYSPKSSCRDYGYTDYSYKSPEHVSYRMQQSPIHNPTPTYTPNKGSDRQKEIGPNPEILARKASRLEERYHSLYSSDSGFRQRMAALTRVTGYTRLSNRAQMEFSRYMRSSMNSGDETGDALRATYLYGEKIRLGMATGNMIAAHTFMAGQKGHIYDTAFHKKLKTDLKSVDTTFKGKGSGFTLGAKLSNAEYTLKGMDRRIEILSKGEGAKKHAEQLALLHQKREQQEALIRDLKAGLKTKRDIKDSYWKERDTLSDFLKKNKKDLRLAESKLGINGVSTSKIKKEIRLLSKKKKLGLLSATEAQRLEQLKIGLAIRKYRLAKQERSNSRKNALSYVYYAFRGNSSYDDATGLHGAVRTADLVNNYYVRKTVGSFYKAIKRVGTFAKKVGKATGKYVWRQVVKTPMGACVDGSILLMKAKANIVKEATKRFVKRQIMTAANTNVGIGMKMYYLNAKKKYTTSVRFIKRWADRGGKVLKVVQAPFRFLLNSFRLIKNLFLKAISIAAGALIFLLLVAVIVEQFGASISVIFAPNVNENGLVDLTEYIEHLEETQEDYVKDLEDILDKDYTRIYRNYSYEDNTKEILCMMAVRMDQNLGTVYHDSTEKDECDEMFRGQCRGHRDDLDYIELLYELSHVAYIQESAPYYCETLDCAERMVEIPVGEEMGRGPTTKMEKYCPGNHVDVTITTQVLRFDEIFTVDTIDSEGEITAKKGESLGTFTITAYCDCEKCCGKDSTGKTATGVKPKENRTIAVDPSVIPLGTVVIINGKTYVAEDTGGAIKGNRIDIFFDSHDDAIAWGKKECTVYLGTDVGVKDNDTTGKSSWEGWTADNIEWAKSLYDSDWEELYEGYRALKLDYSGLGIEIESEEFEKIKTILDSKIGCPYVWGAVGPDSFDCSGLVMYVYEQAGIYDWDGARPTTKSLYQQCVPITKEEAKQGDLVLWDVPGDIHHVGIYCGNDIVCHAPHSGDVVRYAKLWGKHAFYRLPEQ